MGRVAVPEAAQRPATIPDEIARTLRLLIALIFITIQVVMLLHGLNLA